MFLVGLLFALFATLSFTRGVTALSSSVRAGYHVIFSYPGLQPPSRLIELTRQGKVGGIILFKENIGDGTASAIQQIQKAYQQSPGYAGLPLLITTDQEGGQVRRVPGGPTLSAKKIGQAANPPNAAVKAGQEAGAALKPYGINSNLAPVLDVFRQAGDFTDRYERSYSNSPDLVALCGSSFISSQHSNGIISTAKHFPGLGPASSDENTDARPVTINKSLQELRDVDEYPYTRAISSGVDMIMTSWALYPALDSKYPSGLSSSWIQGELRGRLGFKGVTISDAIEAGSLGAFGTVEKRALLASRAGLDIILASARNVTQGEAVVNALASALNDGSLPAAPFDTATQRIMNLRKSIV